MKTQPAVVDNDRCDHGDQRHDQRHSAAQVERLLRANRAAGQRLAQTRRDGTREAVVPIGAWKLLLRSRAVGSSGTHPRLKQPLRFLAFFAEQTGDGTLGLRRAIGRVRRGVAGNIIRAIVASAASTVDSQQDGTIAGNAVAESNGNGARLADTASGEEQALLLELRWR